MATSLSPKQEKVYLELLKLDKRAAEAYKGALKASADQGNPERFPQSAHSLRELTSIISRKVAIPQESGDDSLKKKLEKRFIERPELLPYPAGEKTRALIRKWEDLHRHFFTGVSHHGRETSEEEFFSKLSEFESILLQFLKPTPETFEDLDSLLVIQSPTQDDIKKLLDLLKHPTHVNYFFSRLVLPGWLRPLKEHGFFSKPFDGLREGGYIMFPVWPLTEYLAKVAGQKPREVMNIIKSMGETSNFRVHINLIDCALQMPSPTAKEIVPFAKEWVTSPYLQFIPEKFGELILKLSGEGEMESALDLLATILDVKSPDRKNEGFLRQAQPHFNLWVYEQNLKNVVSEVFRNEPSEVIEILCGKLSKAIGLERPCEKYYRDDHSYIWRSTIESQAQNGNSSDAKNLLVTAIRDSLETLFKRDKEEFRSCYQSLSKFKYPIFRRIELYLMRMFPDLLAQEIQNTLYNRRIFDDICLWHEYYRLLQEQYSRLPEDLRENILKWVKQGPDLEEFEYWHKEKKGILPTEEEKNAHKANWQMSYLSAIKDIVPSEWKEKWNELVAKYGEPEHPDFHVYIGPVVMGSKSPLKKEDIKKKSPQEVVNYLITWKPSKGFLAPSREALGGVLSEVVSEDPKSYVETCKEFITLHPVYIYHLIEGFTGAVKNGNTFDWNLVISLCRDVLITSKPPEILTDKDSYYDRKSVRREIANFLEESLDSKTISPPFELRDSIWELIEILLQDNEPDLSFEGEYGGENMDPVTLSLNTVRGEAMHVLIRYALWCSLCLNLPKDEDRMVPEVKKWLERMLNPEFEPTRTVRSIYGLYLPNLFYLNRVWTQEHMSSIFPKDAEHRTLWRVAWEAYVVYCRPYNDIYEVIREQYGIAINKLASPNISQSAKEKLSEHLMSVYLWGIEGLENDSPINVYFKKAQPEIRRRAIWFIGRTLEQLRKSEVDEKNKERIIERSRDLWKWRIEETKRQDDQARKRSVEELKWFGTWFVHGPFDSTWAISQLNETLELTEGVIEFADDVIDKFRNHVKDHFLDVLRALVLLAKGDKQGLLMVMSKEKIRELIETIIKEQPDQKEIKNSINELIEVLTRRGHHDFAKFFIK